MAYRFEWLVMRNIYDDEMPEFIKTAFSTLSSSEAEVLKWRHVNHLTLDETAKLYGVTRERIRQVEKKAIEKIRHSIALYDESARISKLPCNNIDSLRLSVRTSNCLKRGNIRSVIELAGLSYEQLVELRGVGPQAIDEINEKLVQRGFKPIVNDERSRVNVSEPVSDEGGF